MKFCLFFYAVLLTLFFSFSGLDYEAQELKVINHYGDTTGLGGEQSFYLNNFSQHTLLINYYEPVENESVGKLEKLIGNALSFYVDRLLVLEGNLLVFTDNNKQILKELDEIVSDGIKYYDYQPLQKFNGFSERIELKLKSIKLLDLTLLPIDNLNEQEIKNLYYYNVQKELNDLKLLLNTEIGNFSNDNLLRLSHSNNQVSNDDKDRILEELGRMELHDPLKTIEIELDPTTIAILTPKDDSSLKPSIPKPSTDKFDLLFEMIKANTEKLDGLQLQIANLNQGSNSSMQEQMDQLRFSIATLLQNGQTSTASSLVPNLPNKVTLNFKTASSGLNLGQKYILNELVEVLAFSPRLRIVITGYTDLSGTQSSNLELSRKRSKNVRNFILNRGIDDNRMIMNYYGEKFSQGVNQEDRRVEVEFFVY